ncbi:MAG: TIGR04013 family B12-binding domain/radical SAM domain-containing protein [Methanomicrobiales archaeon]|nr:TIGR04013 family B12-binding domain/radical SAM domain-containing protein [Methanomicrobiales archaeon]
MRVNWRTDRGTRNSFAALAAACETAGITLRPVASPESDITCYSLNSINAPRLLDEIRTAPCITIAGGPHASARYREVAAAADYVVVGEGEYVLPALITAIESGTGTVPAGIATSGAYTPANSCVWLDAYPPFSDIKGTIELSRGCPHACGYCQTPQLFGHRMRHRSIDAVVRAARRYRDVRFVTPNAFAYGSDGRHPRFDRLETLLQKLENDRIFLGTFPSEVRPEWVTDAALELVLQYCANRRVHFGAQSGSDAVLKAIRRGHTVADVIRAVERCRDHGLVPVVDIIVGLPFETDDDQQATIRLAAWIARNGMVHAHYFTPLPGTPLEATVARPLLPETKKTLGRLALAGKATGSWMEPEIRFFRQNQNG